MSELSVVTFHTAPPLEIHYSYQHPPYRDVIGFSSHGSDLWTPRAADTSYTSERYDVNSAFARTLKAFFEAWFNNPDLAWNCHMAAAGMRGLVNWSDEPTARKYAHALWQGTWPKPQEAQELKQGGQGAYVGSGLEHSVVGLSPDEHIQLNGTNERYVSIVPAQVNHDYYFRDPVVSFYTS